MTSFSYKSNRFGKTVIQKFRHLLEIYHKSFYLKIKNPKPDADFQMFFRLITDC